MSNEICDFHMHSFFSDGALLPSEIVRRVIVKWHKAIAITDHADKSNISFLMDRMIPIAKELNHENPDFRLLVGVELTHIPPKQIHQAALEARTLGAEIVVVHGETPVEPVALGTNLAAIESDAVDILAHPGFLTREQVEQGRDRGIFFEISARKGHCLGNGIVARLCQETGAKMLVNSDAHEPGDLLEYEFVKKVILGAGLPESWIPKLVNTYAQQLLKSK